MDINTLIKIRQSLIDKGADADTIKMMDEAIENAREKQNMSDQEIEEASKKASEAAKKQADDVVKSNNRTIASQRETTAAVAETARELGVSEEAIQRFVEEQNRMAEGAASATRQLEAQASRMGMNKKMTDSFTGSLIQAGGLGFAALAESMKSMLTPQALFASGLAQMEGATKKLMKAFDEQQADLARATATTGEYNDMLYDVQETNRAFGVDVEAAGEAIAGLHKELSIFNQMSEVQQKQLTTTTARLKALGVEGAVAAQTFDNMIQGMGMSANMANDAQLEMVALGGAIGVSAEIISKDFNQAAQELSKYGAEAITVFKGLAAAAKATGIEMEGLMTVAGQFDTFEGAAQGAGKLNAILGGGVLNSMDLLNANEEERIRLLIESIALSGKNFESLNRFEKQAIANAAGIKDMTQANKLFSMSLSAYDEMQSKANAASAEQAKLEERAQATQTMMKKFEQIGQAFAVAFMPVLDFLHGFANVILEINDMTGGIFVPTMVVAAGALYFISGGFKATALGMLQTGKSSTTAAAGLQTLVPVLLELGVALALSGPALLGFGLAMAGLALAIAAPIALIGAIIVSFTQLFIAMLEMPDAILAAAAGLIVFAISSSIALTILAVGLAVFISILAGYSDEMMALGTAMIVFGLGLAIVSASLLILGKGLSSVATGISAFADVGFGALVMAATSLAIFAGMLIPIAASMGTAALLVGVAVILLGKGLGSLAQGIREFNTVGAEEIDTMISALMNLAFRLPFVAVQLGVGGLLAGIGLQVIGGGLQSFAIGLKEFNKVGKEAIDKAMGLLALLGLGLPFIAAQLFVGGTLVGAGLNSLGEGLLSFAKGLRRFNRLGEEVIAKTLLTLLKFGFALPFISVQLALGAAMISGPLLDLGLGLQEFGKGLRRFSKVGAVDIFTALAALTAFSVGILAISPLIALVGMIIGGPLKSMGEGLMAFANGLRRFNAVAAESIGKAIASLTGLAVTLIFLSPLFLGMLLVGNSLIAFGQGLQEFGRGLRRFNNIGGEAIATALGALTAFAIGMALLLPVFILAGPSMLLAAVPLMAFGYALGILGEGLRKVSRSVGALDQLAGSITRLAMVGVAGMFALGAVSSGISGIAAALEEVPAEKAIAFGVTMDGYSKMLAQVNQLEPESVASAEELVGIAQEYAQVQAEMKMPEADAFVQAMRQYFGLDAEGNQAGGQDIVLKLNNREFARAVDAAINKAHNLRID